MSEQTTIREEVEEPRQAVERLIESIQDAGLRERMAKTFARLTEEVADLQSDCNANAWTAAACENNDPRWLAEQLAESLRFIPEETIKKVATCIAEGRASDLWKVLP